MKTQDAIKNLLGVLGNLNSVAVVKVQHALDATGLSWDQYAESLAIVRSLDLPIDVSVQDAVGFDQFAMDSAMQVASLWESRNGQSVGSEVVAALVDDIEDTFANVPREAA